MKKILQSGFSLIEISMALVIGGLFMAGSIQAYRIATVTDPITITNNNFQKIDKALSKFLAKNGRLACPADPKLRPPDSGVGTEVCGTVPTGCTSSSGFCVTIGRDADGIIGGDNVLIGSVPYVTLGIIPDDIYDGWERKIKYAVTENLTNNLTYDVDLGAIYIVNAEAITDITKTGFDIARITPDYKIATNPTPPTNVNALSPYPYGSAQFALISNGINRENSYVFNGLGIMVKISGECSSIKASSIIGLDFENCNNDAYFFSDKGRSSKLSFHYYDDMVYQKFRIKPYSDGKWSYTGTKPPVGVLPSIITSNPSARVGIGTSTPSQSLEVRGNIKANKFYAKKICDVNGNNCFSPKLIAGSGTAACAGNITNKGNLVGFKNGKEKCANSTFTLPNVTGLGTEPRPNACRICAGLSCLTTCGIAGNFDINCTVCTSGNQTCDIGTSMYGFDSKNGAVLCR